MQTASPCAQNPGETETALRRHCRDNEIAARDVCEAAGVTDQAARSWLKGTRKPSAKHCRSLTKALGIPLTVLRPDVYADTAATGDPSAA